MGLFLFILSGALNITIRHTNKKRLVANPGAALHEILEQNLSHVHCML